MTARGDYVGVQVRHDRRPLAGRSAHALDRAGAHVAFR